MSLETKQRFVDDLERLLDQERHALVQGELEQISELILAKEKLVEKINAFEVDETVNLSVVRDKVTRNQALLNSALEGIRAVADRMADLRRVRAGLETYDRRGRRNSIGISPGQTVEKRA